MPIAVFDINETTLDLAPVRSSVNELLGHSHGFTIWFQKLLQLSMAATTTGSYRDFGALAQSALDAVAAADGRTLPDDAWSRVGRAMGSLSAYPDVVPGLTTLRSAGWSTVALTNSAPATVEAQLAGAGVAALFDRVLSVDGVAAYKPAAAPYLHAAEQCEADPGDLWMVACHDWDLAGARAVGMRTAFLSRPAMSYALNYAAPDLIAADFNDLATQMLRWSPGP